MIDRDISAWAREELWDQVPVNISVINSEHEIVEANSRFTETYGEWKNRTCYEVYKGFKDQCKSCAAMRTMEDGRIRVREEKGVLPGGETHYYLVHMVPLVRQPGDIPFVIEMSTDITATKKLEEEKVQAERLAAVGETVAGLAHGVKNVLTALDGGMYLARTGIKNGDINRMLHGWDMLEDSIGRISTFVKEFLNFAKGQELNLSPTDINGLVRNVVHMFESAAQLQEIALEYELDDSIVPVLMDEDGIHSCLTNLVSNALDACKMSEKGTGRVTVKTREKDDQIQIEVRDDGIGIDAEISKNVFTNFFSTKGSDKGTGLGLLTTRKIVQAHHGRVSFDSTPGKGAMFLFEFDRNRLSGMNGHNETWFCNREGDGKKEKKE